MPSRPTRSLALGVMWDVSMSDVWLYRSRARSNLLAWPILGHLWYVAPLLWYCQGACLRGAAHTNRGQSEGSLPKDQGARQWKDVKRLHARFMPGHGLIQLSWRCKSCHEENHRYFPCPWSIYSLYSWSLSNYCTISSVRESSTFVLGYHHRLTCRGGCLQEGATLVHGWNMFTQQDLNHDDTVMRLWSICEE